jgi:diguanylate cyclase (GGDEF)-like protein/PAS domain S-box-containing protein
LHTANARRAALQRNLKTLEFNRRRLAETQDIAKIGAWEWDVRQPRQVWSDGLYRLLGRAVGDPPEPTDAFFIAHVVHPEDIALVRDALKNVLENGAPIDLQCRVVLPDGSERIVSTLTRLETADDGAQTRLVGTVRDITDQHRAAARERERLVFIQTMMDAIPIPVFQKDPEGRYQACNEAFCRFAGRTREQIIGKVFDGYTSGPQVAAVREQDRALLARPAASMIEIKLPNSAGDVRQLMVHKASYLADDGTIAGLVGVIFDNTEQKIIEQRLRHTVEELDRRNGVSQLLGEFSEVLQSCMAIDEAYEMVAKYLPQLAPGSSGLLYRIDPSYRRGDKVIAWGSAVAAANTLVGDDCVAVRRSRARTVGDSTKELNCRHFTGEPPPAYACLPLLAHGELIGLLHVERLDTDPDKEFASDIAWTALTTAAEHIGLALANLGLRETLREQATHDKLTGLYNRHYLNARFEQELARARRKKDPLAVIMLDIDHFKRFNDTFGHAAGDHVLRELARVVIQSSRKSDVACRYGGEEFVLFLPEAPAEIALKRAEEIREALKALQLDWEGQPLGSVTLSAGVAIYPDHGQDPDTLLRFADRALYQAKQLGRDRVVLEPVPATVAKIGRAQQAG